MTGLVAGALVVGAAATLATPASARRRLRRLVGIRTIRHRWLIAITSRFARGLVSRTAVLLGAVLLGAGLGGLIYGPVAGLVGAGYAGFGAHRWLGRRAADRERRAMTDALDGVSALVGDLRAGIAPQAALGAALPLLTGVPSLPREYATVDDLPGQESDGARGRLLVRLTAAWRLAESTGAALADVLERLDAQVRAEQRARALAMSHAAGARATAMLLAGLPIAGIALGYGIGADPMAVLFGTPIGAGCAIGAVGLQLAGLIWVDRLAQVEPESVEVRPARRPWAARLTLQPVTGQPPGLLSIGGAR